MVLTDYQIKERFSTFIPYDAHRDEDLINPASFDVRIGTTMQLEKASGMDSVGSLPRTIGELRRRDRERQVKNFHSPISLGEDEVYWLKPGEFILISMLEVIKVPNDCEMMFALKSTRGREGYEHANSGKIDPGWCGVLTMELKNNLEYHYLPIYTGLRIGQLTVNQLRTDVMRPYKGRYQYASTVEAGKVREYDFVPVQGDQT